jgi:hypothetical protein
MSVNVIKIYFFVESATPDSIGQGKALPFAHYVGCVT